LGQAEITVVGKSATGEVECSDLSLERVLQQKSLVGEPNSAKAGDLRGEEGILSLAKGQNKSKSE